MGIINPVFKECNDNDVALDYVISQEGSTFIFKRHVVNDVVNDVVNGTITDVEKIIIELIKNDPYISAEKIGIKINKSSRTIQRSLARLKEIGVINRVGGTKGYWKVIK
ncbi:MAG: HTH domain-containing protein [Clostridia bacterium]|nr:HTH domain-containing protein [Clostridia bacterium]